MSSALRIEVGSALRTEVLPHRPRVAGSLSPMLAVAGGPAPVTELGSALRPALTQPSARMGDALRLMLDTARGIPVVSVDSSSVPPVPSLPITGTPELVTHNGIVVTHEGSAVYVLV